MVIAKSAISVGVLFVVGFSLLSLPSAIPWKLYIYPAKGNLQNCNTVYPTNSCSEYWVPSGPAMDTYVATIFTDGRAEATNIQSSSPSIDFTDAPATALQLPTYQTSNNFLVTQPVETGVMEIQFDLANNFWGCDFGFGSSTCGIQIRQGIAHLIDRSTFVQDESSLHGLASALDNPLPLNNGGLEQPNPCNWDTAHIQTGSGCVVGASGGTAYHLAKAAGNLYQWQFTYGSRDFCAAADHFISASLATGKDNNCVLTGINSAVTSHPVRFFIRNDMEALDLLGISLLEEICALFGQGFSEGCVPSYINLSQGPITAFPGRSTSNTSVSTTWGIYTADATAGASEALPFAEVLEGLIELAGTDPFDTSLYWTYNSRFASGISSIVSPNGPCASSAIPRLNAADYIYLCDASFDSLDNQMEFAPCISASGDPSFGQSNPTYATCPNTNQLTAFSAGYKAEDLFGQRVYSIPVYGLGVQNGYLAGWSRVINADMAGSNNFFTALDAWNPNPTVPGVIRQGFSETTSSMNPYIASSPYDFMMLGLIYDTLGNVNPLSNGQYFNDLALSVQGLPNFSLTYAPPANTAETFRFTLRNDAFFQDGERVTAFDVAFSYLSLVATGAFEGVGASFMTGVTVLGWNQIDIGVSSPDSNGIFEQLALASVPILPGKYWNGDGPSAWHDTLQVCTATCFGGQYTLNGPPATNPTVSCALNCNFPVSLMKVNPTKGETATDDPIFDKTLVGSGPWECGPVTSSGSSTGCSSSGAQNPPVGGSYILTRFGKGLAPGSSIQNIYFRSSGNLALYLWSQATGDINHDFLNFSVVASCFGAPVTSTGSCAHFQQGIGGLSGGGSVGLSQVSLVNRFVGLNWVAPLLNWGSASGIIPLNPVLYENTITLNPASIAGCTSPYPTGGYDC